MKNKLRLSVVLLIIFVFLGCFDTLQENGRSGTISINISSFESINISASSQRAVYPPTNEMRAEMQHRIILQGPTGTQRYTLPAGTTSATITVAAGLWNVTIEAYYQGSLYARGSGSVNVIAGRNNPVSIQMSPAATPPTDTTPEYGISFTDEGGTPMNVLDFGTPTPGYTLGENAVQVRVNNIGKNPTGPLTITNSNNDDFELLNWDGGVELTGTYDIPDLDVGDYFFFTIRPVYGLNQTNTPINPSTTVTVVNDTNSIFAQITGIFRVPPSMVVRY